MCGRANPLFFDKNRPYAQLYGFNSVYFCAGLPVGPLLSGALRDVIGYGNMNVMVAINDRYHLCAYRDLAIHFRGR